MILELQLALTSQTPMLHGLATISRSSYVSGFVFIHFMFRTIGYGKTFKILMYILLSWKKWCLKSVIR